MLFKPNFAAEGEGGVEEVEEGRLCSVCGAKKFKLMYIFKAMVALLLHTFYKRRKYSNQIMFSFSYWT